MIRFWRLIWLFGGLVVLNLVNWNSLACEERGATAIPLTLPYMFEILSVRHSLWSTREEIGTWQPFVGYRDWRHPSLFWPLRFGVTKNFALAEFVLCFVDLGSFHPGGDRTKTQTETTNHAYKNRMWKQFYTAKPFVLCNNSTSLLFRSPQARFPRSIHRWDGDATFAGVCSRHFAAFLWYQRNVVGLTSSQSWLCPNGKLSCPLVHGEHESVPHVTIGENIQSECKPTTSFDPLWSCVCI